MREKMEKRDLVGYLAIAMIFVGLIGLLLVLRGGLTGFAIFSEQISAFAQAEIFFDGFESGISGWTLSRASGANDWTASTTNPYQGSYHAQSQPMSTTEPASIMEKTISTLGYQNIIINYSRRLIGLDGVDEFQLEWYDGSSWAILEQTGGASVDDADYISKQFSLSSSANNNPAFAIKFECTAGATSEYCRVDNVKISGDEIITDTTPPTINIVYPQNINYNINISQLNYTYSDANPGACWYSTNNGATNSSAVSAGQNFTDIISAEGSNIWIVYCNDSIGNKNSASITFFKDTIVPLISINYPQNNSNHSSNSISINYSASDINLQACWWTNNSGQTNITITCGQEIIGTWNQGYNIVIIYVNDTSGNKNTSSITFYIDSVAPNVNIILPQEGAAYGYNLNLVLNYSTSDVNLRACWYNINNGNNITLSNCDNTTFSVAGNGNYIINVYANDSLGNLGKDNASFSVQIGAPTIILHSPIDSYLNSQNIIFRYTPSDIDLQACELWGNFNGNFELNQTNNSPNNGIENNFSLTLPDETYLWNIKCNDSQGNSAFNGNKTFFIDTTFPSLSLIEPTGTKTSRTGISANWQVSDINLQNCWYSVYQGASPEITNTFVNCSLNTTSFSVSSDGDFVFNFYVNDSAGNENSTSSSFSVSTSQPPSSQPSVGGGGGGGGTTTNISVAKGKLELSKISNLIVNPGESRKLVLSAKNIGKSFLNDCKLVGKGENAEWTASSGTKGLSPGEKQDFIFTLNIPEKLTTGKYNIELNLACNEYNESTIFIAEILEKKLAVDLVNVERASKDKLRVIYSLTELSNVAQEVRVEIILFGLGNERLAELIENKNLKANEIQEIEAVLNISESLEGNYNLLISAISETSSTFVQEEIVLGSSKVGGFAIFGGVSGDIIFSVILIALFVIFLILILRRIFKFRKLKKHIDLKNLKKSTVKL